MLPPDRLSGHNIVCPPILWPSGRHCQSNRTFQRAVAGVPRGRPEGGPRGTGPDRDYFCAWKILLSYFWLTTQVLAFRVQLAMKACPLPSSE